MVPFGCGLFACTFNLPNSTCDVLFLSKCPTLQPHLQKGGRASVLEPSIYARPKTEDGSNNTTEGHPPSKGLLHLEYESVIS